MEIKFLIPILFVSALLISCKEEKNQNNKNLKYPETPKKPIIDTLFGTAVTDNYRWLEDDRSKETEAWVQAENKITFNYLSKIPYRDQLKERLTHLWNYEKVGTPYKEGEYTYFSKNDGLQNQSVVYRKKEESGTEEIFLDPNTFSKDATTSLGVLSFSKDGKAAAYSISEGGSDWRKIIVIDAASKISTEDALVDIKFLAFLGTKTKVFIIRVMISPKEVSCLQKQISINYITIN